MFTQNQNMHCLLYTHIYTYQDFCRDTFFCFDQLFVHDFFFHRDYCRPIYKSFSIMKNWNEYRKQNCSCIQTSLQLPRNYCRMVTFSILTSSTQSFRRCIAQYNECGLDDFAEYPHEFHNINDPSQINGSPLSLNLSI